MEKDGLKIGGKTMNIRDAFSAKAIAMVNKEAASNKQEYLGIIFDG